MIFRKTSYESDPATQNGVQRCCSSGRPSSFNLGRGSKAVIGEVKLATIPGELPAGVPRQ